MPGWLALAGVAFCPSFYSGFCFGFCSPFCVRFCKGWRRAARGFFHLCGFCLRFCCGRTVFAAVFCRVRFCLAWRSQGQTDAPVTLYADGWYERGGGA